MIEGTIRWIWKCKSCEDVVISYSHERHKINSCDKGCSSVDLEDGYSRITGDIDILSTKEYDGSKWIRDAWNEEETERRMKIIGQNGNSGEHYE